MSDFKAHAVVVGGSWHFREKVSGPNFFYLNLCHVVKKKFQKKKVKESEKQTCHLGTVIYVGKTGGASAKGSPGSSWLSC